jgi:hypothetical protein
MKNNDMQNRIKKLLEIDPREFFVVNNSRFECHFRSKSGKPFSEWEKDQNSPSLFCNARLNVYDRSTIGSSLNEGMILVQLDNNADNPLSATLYIKKLGAEKWKSMHLITSLIV